eukprot:3050128-Rhodomonas_salina.4
MRADASSPNDLDTCRSSIQSRLTEYDSDPESEYNGGGVPQRTAPFHDAGQPGQAKRLMEHARTQQMHGAREYEEEEDDESEAGGQYIDRGGGGVEELVSDPRKGGGGGGGGGGGEGREDWRRQLPVPPRSRLLSSYAAAMPCAVLSYY